MNQLLGALDKLIQILDKLVGGLDPNAGHQPGAGATGPAGGYQPSPGIWEGGCYPKPTPKPIAGEARIWGDPHFVGADGGKYDIQGRPGGIYNLLSDQGFQMNGRFDAWGGNGATVVGEVGIVAGGNEITVKKCGGVTINGRPLCDGESVTLCDGTKVTKNGDTVTIESAEWDVKISAQDSSRGDYLNIDVSTDNAVADGVRPHGLLGQSFDGDGEAREGDMGSGAQGGGAIETVGGDFTEAGDTTTVGSYEVSGMHAVGDSLFSRYGPEGAGEPTNRYQDPMMNIARMGFGFLAVSMLMSQYNPTQMNYGNQSNW